MTSSHGVRDWGAHVKRSDKDVKSRGSKVHDITVVRIAEFINNVVGTRQTKERGAVVMKLDVEVGKTLEVKCAILTEYQRDWSWRS